MPLKQRWTWEFDAPRERIWTYIADTDWINEHAGLPRITPRLEPLPGGGSRKFGSFRQGPMYVEWEERPTIWKAPEFFTVDRLYSHGPLRRFLNTTTLETISPQRTRVIVDIELEAASGLFDAMLPLIAGQGKRGADRAFRLAARLAAGDVTFKHARSELNAKFQKLQAYGIDAQVLRSITDFVESSEDRDLVRMRPYELADRWQLPRREVLRAFLAATRAGLLNLRWSVICPGCRGPSPGIETLSSVQGTYHCPSCNVPFDALFDRSVEVTFNAQPLGKIADVGMFCLASPQRSAHVYAQTPVQARETVELGVVLPSGSYDVKAIAVGVAPFNATVEETSRELRAAISSRGVEAPAAVGNGEIHVTVANETDREAIVRIEDGRWPDTITTAAQVTALQEFRDLFSSEVLAPGLELGIESTAVLFTDLVGSTAMYSRTGDAPAFKIVSDHFDVLREIVARHEGAIVKTIGDAVMAVFVDPGKCFDAAMELDDRVMTIEHDGMPLRLRVGFHAGPCIAMRANDRIDYFGTTVNLAARLQSLAGAGEVTMAAADARHPAVAQRLSGLPVRVSNESLAIKGFARDVEVVRVAQAGA